VKDNYRKLRLQEFNRFDIERTLKNTIDHLVDENDDILEFLNSNAEFLDKDTVVDLSERAANNSSEIVHVSSVLTHTDDVYSYFSQGPLFRKDRDA